MVLTINPAVSGARRMRHAVHVASYLGGLFGGAVATLGVAWVVGRLLTAAVPAAVAAAVAGALVAVVVARDLGAPVRGSYIERQVPEWLRGMMPAGFVALVFGFILGLGFATRYTFSAHMAMVVAAPLLGLRELLLVAAAFAVAKGLNLIAAPTGVPISELGAAFDRRAFFRQYGTQTLRVANAFVASAVLASLLL